MLKNELFSNKGSGQQSLRYGVPEEWAWRRLSELMSSYSGGTPSRENHEFYTGSIPWIRSSELNNKYIETTAESISEDAVAHSSAKYVSPGTLLYEFQEFFVLQR
ncbi:MAG: restriction endonuclease subunit S [Candidatus Brocadiales bacterium]|nr:restriction endonuclease subunit S [Candidatus Brocadiales bacterium]